MEVIMLEEVLAQRLEVNGLEVNGTILWLLDRSRLLGQMWKSLEKVFRDVVVKETLVFRESLSPNFTNTYMIFDLHSSFNCCEVFHFSFRWSCEVVLYFHIMPSCLLFLVSCKGSFPFL